MSSKKMTMLGMVVGSIAGGYVPTLFGADGISFTSLICSAVGAVLGIVLFYRLSR